LAIVIDVTFTNPTGNASNVACDAEAKISGVYRHFDFVAINSIPGTFGSTSALAPFLLHAGETFSVNTNNAGLSVWPYIVEFDASTPIADARLLSFSAGNNTVFTVPAGKTISFGGMPSSSTGPMRGKVWYFNLSGATRTVQINVVPSGGSPAVGNAIFNGGINSDAMAQPLMYGGLAPGDFINVNVDASTASQIAWVIYTTQ
jgi:hypothetical protein